MNAKVIIVPGKVLSVEIHGPMIRTIVAQINPNHYNSLFGISAERAAELIKETIEKELNWTVGSETKKF